MTRNLLIILVALTALLSFGCDRFKHDFAPPVVTDFNAELFTPLQTAFSAQPTGGIEVIMSYYADDYLHFGALKADRRTWLEGIYQVEPSAEATVTLLASQELSDSTAVVNWRLLITTPSSKTTLADSTFTGDRLIKRDDHWLLKGNQMTCQLPTPQQHVVIDYFTFLTCPNCPIVEAKLEALQAAYPNQLSYLEHHTNDQLTIPSDGTQAYYATFSSPASVVQGKFKLLGNLQEVLDSYDPLVQSLAEMNSEFRYSNPVFSVDVQTISGSISLECLAQDFDYTNLALKYVLIERVSQYNNAEGVPAKNVVRAIDRIPITEADFANPIPFTLNSTVPIPDDASIVIYAQTIPDVFNNDATIHGGVEIPLDRSVISFK